MSPNTEKKLTQSGQSTDPVLHVTRYDRVVSLLLSVILTTTGMTLALAVMWWANRPASSDRVKEIQLLNVDLGDDWGGVPDGDSGDSWDNPGPESAEPSVGGDASDLDAVSELQRTITGVLDRVSEAVEISDRLSSGGDSELSGLRSGSRGTDWTRPRGDGPGPSRGVPLNRRWEIRFASGLTVEEYARQLDFLQVELGVIVDGKLYKVSQYSSSKPLVHEADLALARKELFFVWRDESRRQVDLGLVRRSSLQSVPGEVVIMHFYPVATIKQLAELERSHAAAHGRSSLRDVAKTRFTVHPLESGYRFEITQQTYLASSAP